MPIAFKLEAIKLVRLIVIKVFRKGVIFISKIRMVLVLAGSLFYSGCVGSDFDYQRSVSDSSTVRFIYYNVGDESNYLGVVRYFNDEVALGYISGDEVKWERVL